MITNRTFVQDAAKVWKEPIAEVLNHRCVRSQQEGCCVAIDVADAMR
jgi:hypothetical protein